MVDLCIILPSLQETRILLSLPLTVCVFSTECDSVLLVFFTCVLMSLVMFLGYTPPPAATNQASNTDAGKPGSQSKPVNIPSNPYSGMRNMTFNPNDFYINVLHNLNVFIEVAT